MKKIFLLINIVILVCLSVLVDTGKDSLNYVAEVMDLTPSVNVALLDIIETGRGTVTAYEPKCKGCSGIMASGYNVKKTMYYHDDEYGDIRIVAADKKYKFGTIVRFSNIKNYDDMIVIVLDRGGAIGINKRAQFDLLFSSATDATKFGVKKDVKYEILRLGF